MKVVTKDITVAWGQPPHPLDAQYGYWRLAMFVDMQESLCRQKLFFLYDPDKDYKASQTGGKKGVASIVVFDLHLRCFVAACPIPDAAGEMKSIHLSSLPSPQNGSSLVLLSEQEHNCRNNVHIFRIDMAADCLSIVAHHALTSSPLNPIGVYTCAMRKDIPEIVIVSQPGITIHRIPLSDPIRGAKTIVMPNGTIKHFWEGLICNGKAYFMQPTDEGFLDTTRLHVIPFDPPGLPYSVMVDPDDIRGFPQLRKQPALAMKFVYKNKSGILLAGGEIDRGAYIERLLDYWVLTTSNTRWTQIEASMPVPLTEPRLTCCHSDNIYLWGDFDQSLPGLPLLGAHLRILSIKDSERKEPCAVRSQEIQFRTRPTIYPSSIDSIPRQLPFPQYPSYQEPQRYYNISTVPVPAATCYPPNNPEPRHSEFPTEAPKMPPESRVPASKTIHTFQFKKQRPNLPSICVIQ